MKFEFRYESVLSVRQFRKKKEQQRLAACIQQRNVIRKRYRELREQGAASSRNPESESVSVHEVRQDYEQRHQLQKQLWQLRNKRDKLEKEVSKQRKRLVEANRESMILEKLKQRERIKFIEHQQHIEQLQQNEIATQMYNRR
ncbi:flagellar export protein FliJ [Fodinibius sediminis]|uniref:Flagellar export protein FliJ n=1 Tax=Fodinibius sediminis TaxID=1214077 RepID=A0A521CIU3_9BACT|nr:flagellar FliJ family protein [Fodinibius sediminis]SMO59393.1 flagellar export protein FliJ [Fodinibius sediminis]